MSLIKPSPSFISYWRKIDWFSLKSLRSCFNIPRTKQTFKKKQVVIKILLNYFVADIERFVEQSFSGVALHKYFTSWWRFQKLLDKKLSRRTRLLANPQLDIWSKFGYKMSNIFYAASEIIINSSITLSAIDKKQEKLLKNVSSELFMELIKLNVNKAWRKFDRVMHEFLIFCAWISRPKPDNTHKCFSWG